MEKIILVVCSTTSNNAVDFACYLSDISHAKLIGYSFKMNEEETNVLQTRSMLNTDTGDSDSPEMSISEKKSTTSVMQTFEDACEARGIKASIRYTEGPVLNNIIPESRFADLIIVDATAPFLQKLLVSAQCPVIVAPRHCTSINEVVFCYDGSRSAIFAMKQLIYLLPELGDKKATIVHMGVTTIPHVEKKSLASWLSRHFECITITTLKDNTAETLSDFLQNRQEALVVMGAYGRNLLSRLIKHSYADQLIKAPAHTIFITH